jgi:hypothetical protein
MYILQIRIQCQQRHITLCESEGNFHGYVQDALVLPKLPLPTLAKWLTLPELLGLLFPLLPLLAFSLPEQ